MVRVALVASHVIQYQAPFFRLLAKHPEVDLTVFYCSRAGAEVYRDTEMQTTLRWDLDLLSGYRHRFLRNLGRGEGYGRLVNPGLVPAILFGRFDAVILFMGWGTITSLLAIAACRASGTPFFLYGDSSFPPPAETVARRARARFIRTVFRVAGGFLVSGHLNAEYYRHYGADPSRFFLVPWAIDNERFAEARRMTGEEREVLRREIVGASESGPRAEGRGRREEGGRQNAEGRGQRTDGREPASEAPRLPDFEAPSSSPLGPRPSALGPLLIVYSAKLLPRKDPMTLLRAVARMRNRERAVVLFLGHGELRESLERYAAEERLRVHFAGFVNQSELPRYYAAGDVFVLPSVYEPRGAVINEAMACGLPVVVTDRCGSIGDIVLEGENAFIYPAGDDVALAAQLDALADDSELRARMAKRSREIIEGWSYERGVKGVLAALRATK